MKLTVSRIKHVKLYSVISKSMCMSFPVLDFEDEDGGSVSLFLTYQQVTEIATALSQAVEADKHMNIDQEPIWTNDPVLKEDGGGPYWGTRMTFDVGDVGFLVKRTEGSFLRYNLYSRPTHTPVGEPTLYGSYSATNGQYITALGLARVEEVDGERARFVRWSGPEACAWLNALGYTELAVEADRA